MAQDLEYTGVIVVVYMKYHSTQETARFSSKYDYGAACQLYENQKIYTVNLLKATTAPEWYFRILVSFFGPSSMCLLEAEESVPLHSSVFHAGYYSLLWTGFNKIRRRRGARGRHSLVLLFRHVSQSPRYFDSRALSSAFKHHCYS